MKTYYSFLVYGVAFICSSNFSHAQAPNLGTANSFTLFTSAGAFSSTGIVAIYGDVGTDVGAFTGSPYVSGAIHIADAATAQAATDIGAAYTTLSTKTCDSVLGTPFGSGRQLNSGVVYCIGSAAALNGDLILDAHGNSNSIFIIKIDGALSTSTLSKVVLTNSALACNVFWQVNGAVSLGNLSEFKGTIIANGALDFLDGAVLEGSGFSIAGAISLYNNRVNKCLGLKCAGNPAGTNIISGDQNISTQTQMDNFYSKVTGGNFGKKWTKVIGMLHIDGGSTSDPITNLCNLTALLEVTRSIELVNFNKSGNPIALGDLANLTTIGCWVYIVNSPQFVNITLPGISTIGCSLKIQNNANLQTISFPMLKSIKGDFLDITNHPKLETLSLSSSASSFGFIGKSSTITISNNGNANTNPLTMDLKKITKIVGPLVFTNNDNSGVNNFDNIFTGLTSTSANWGSITITNNDYLGTCCIAALVTTTHFKSHTISGNTGNCLDTNAVKNSCGVLHKMSGINAKVQHFGYTLYPNPSLGEFTIEGTSQFEGNLNLTVTDNMGRVVLVQSNPIKNTISVPINMVFASEGIYILRIELNGQRSIQRLMMVK